MSYKPNAETAELLNWLLEKIKSVPYDVTLRWAFYRCVQERGLAKEDYGKVKSCTAKARKNFWNGWTPWTLVDDTRAIYSATSGCETFAEWLRMQRGETPIYDVYSKQRHIVQIWFEAQAMCSQFAHYAAPFRIPFTPFKGDASVHHKWRIAARLAELYRKYRKPVVILYFGDYEPFMDRGSRGKGIRIPLDALEDIRTWFYSILLKQLKPMSLRTLLKAVELKFVRVGLNEEHIDLWNLPENPERLGEYQWEALDDSQAKSLIVSSVERFWNRKIIDKIAIQERQDAVRWRAAIDKLLDAIGGRKG